MNDNVRRKLEKFEREAQFMSTHAGDFTGGVGEVAALEQQGIIDEIHGLSGEQGSGDSVKTQQVANLADLEDALIAFLKQMNLAANAFKNDVPGSDTLFRMPRNRARHALLATARAFYTDSAPPLEQKFKDYGLAATFRADLQQLIDDIEAASAAADAGAESRAGATGALIDAARRGMDVSRRLNSIVRIKFANEPKYLAAWEVASHLEKAPKKKDAPDPQPI